MQAAGLKVSVVTDTVSNMIGLQRKGVDWETVDGADLMRHCAGQRNRLDRLRRGLRYMFTDAGQGCR